MIMQMNSALEFQSERCLGVLGEACVCDLLCDLWISCW